MCKSEPFLSVSQPEYRKVWCSVGLETFPKDSLPSFVQGFDIELLTEWGLPINADPLLSFGPSTLALDGTQVERPTNANGFRIGLEDSRVPFLILKSGEIARYSIQASDEILPRVNGSLAQLIDSLTAYRLHNETVSSDPEMSDDEYHILGLKLRSALERIDREAILSPSSWWSLVLEQVLDGLL